MDQTNEQKYSEFLSKLRKRAIKDGDIYLLPILSTAVFTSSVETMGTNGKNLFINPDWVLTLSEEEAIGVLWHELLHDLFMAHSRRWAVYKEDSGISKKEWHDLTNVAMDITVNDAVRSHGKQLPKGVLLREELQIPPELDTPFKIFTKLLKEYKGNKELAEKIAEAMRQLNAQQQQRQSLQNVPKQQGGSTMSLPLSGQQQQDSQQQGGQQQDSQSNSGQSGNGQQQDSQSNSGQSGNGQQQDGQQQGGQLATSGSSREDDLAKRKQELNKKKEDFAKKADKLDGEDKDNSSVDKLAEEEALKEEEEALKEEEEALKKEEEALKEEAALKKEGGALKKDSEPSVGKGTGPITNSEDIVDYPEELDTERPGGGTVINNPFLVAQKELSRKVAQQLQDVDAFTSSHSRNVTISRGNINYIDDIFDFVGSFLAHGGTSRSYHRPNRRASRQPSPSGLFPILPGKVRKSRHAMLAIFLDISGSMYGVNGIDDQPNYILDKLRTHITQLENTRSQIYPFGSSVHRPIDISGRLPRYSEGTSIDAVLEAANTTPADIIILITDMEDTVNLAKLDGSIQMMIVTNNPRFKTTGQLAQNIEINYTKNF